MARPRKNNAEYFSHDSGMRNNRKIKALRAKHGNNGYTVFCMTLEMLTDTDNFTVSLDEVEMELIAADFGFTVVELRDIWNTAKNLRLIEFENDNLNCPALIERLQPMVDERIRQREKAAKRWLSKDETKPVDNSTKVLPRENHATAMQSKVKESKEYNSPESSDPVPGENGQTQKHIPYQTIIEMWNNTLCPPLSKVTKITDSRKKKIKVRFIEMEGNEKGIETLKQLFEKIKTNKFLLGDGSKGWKVAFDWVFENDSNWVKIMEDHYSGPPVNTKPQPESFTPKMPVL